MQFIETERERCADEGKPPIEWGLYLELAEAMTQVDTTEREPVLATHGLPLSIWNRAERYWMLTLALDIQRGQMERALAYGRASAQTGTLPSPAGRPTEAQTAAPSAEPAIPAVTVVPHRTAELPAIVTPSSAPEPKLLPSFLRAAEMVPAPPPMAAMAPPPLAPVPPPAAVTPPLVTASAPTFKGTIDFVPADLVPALPFGGAPSPEYVARLAAASGPAATPARSDRPGATVMDLSPAKLLSLPFPGARGAAVVPVPAASAALAGSAAPPQPLPTAPELTLEQHAMLSAELSVLRDGPSRAAALTRYGVDGIATLTALGARWKERLQADPAAAARWKAVYTEHQKGHAQKPR